MKKDEDMCLRPSLRADKNAMPRDAAATLPDGRYSSYSYMKTRKTFVPRKTPALTESRMLNWIVTFFMLAVLAAVVGFGGPVGWAEDVAKSLSVLFVILFAAALIYGVVGSRATRNPFL